MTPQSDSIVRHGSGKFQTTLWTQVVTASARTDESVFALEDLCRNYWRPLFVFVRRRGYDEHQAEDLIQEFFHRFLQSESLTTVDRTKGRFRTFLLGALKNFLSNDRRDKARLKRGGEVDFLSLDELQSEAVADDQDVEPDLAFDQRWARVVVADARERLRQEMISEGYGKRFEILGLHLQGTRPGVPYSELAGELELSESAVKTIVFRMRRRYGELIREIIASTVALEEEVDEEIRYLIEILPE